MELLMDPSIWVGLLTLVVPKLSSRYRQPSSLSRSSINCRQSSVTKRLIGLAGADYASGAAVHYFVAGDLNSRFLPSGILPSPAAIF